MSQVRAAFEISPLFEAHWSGIPVVTAHLAKQCLLDRELDWVFLYENIVIPRNLLSHLLIKASGEGFLSELERLLFNGSTISKEDASSLVCVWPNIKSLIGRYKREAVIIHDLSTLLTPEFHHPDTIAHHSHRVASDCESSEHIFCVSEATRRDVMHYLGISGEKLSVIPLGVEFNLGDLHAEVSLRRRVIAEKYVVVLGTLEPRKNGGIIFEMLGRDPALAGELRFVFVGRDGWLNERSRLVDDLKRFGIDDDRVLFTGFVDDQIKMRLLLNCQFAIFPSRFEGFGLPVLECAALGKVVVASNSSSIPEVAPSRSVFFDPTDVESLRVAVRKAQRLAAFSGHGKRSFTDISRDLGERPWLAAYQHMRRWVTCDGRERC
jgi:glycosyltransferase involved in cell wall biosynthesis